MTDNYCLTRHMAIIGCDACTPDLPCIDQVATALYNGDCQRPIADVPRDVGDLCHSAITRVLQQGRITAKQVAIIVIGDLVISDAREYASSQNLANLGDALHAAQGLIEQQPLAVLLIAANMDAVNSVQQEKATISFADDFTGYGASLGFCALLLSSLDLAARLNAYQYGVIAAAVSSRDLTKPLDEIIKQSLQQAQISREQVSAIEVTAPAQSPFAQLEATGVIKGYTNGTTLHTGITCSKSVLGDNGALSQLFGLLHCVLALQLRYRPAIKEWSAPIAAQLSAWLDSPFYIFNAPATAFANADKSPRYMAYSCLSSTQYSHLLLKENDHQGVRTNGFNAHSDLSLFIISADSEAQLTKQIISLIDGLDAYNLKTLARSLYENSQQGRYKLVLVAQSKAALHKELTLAVDGVGEAFAHHREWKTPKGSYFSAQPIHNAQKIAFTYPGIGASYLGLGRQLLQLFPQIYPMVTAMVDDLGATLQERLLYPRSLTPLTFKQRQEYDLALRNELANIAQCGIAYASMVSKIFTQVFTVQPDFSCGYSMGEVSMFTALDCWQNPQLMSQRLHHSTTFKQRLAGELAAIREHWQLSDVGDTPIWESYSVKANVEQVEQVLLVTDRVYITIINSPDSLVIAGYPEDCRAVCQRLGQRAIALQVANAIHCPPAYSEYDNMQRLYTLDVAHKKNCKMYSSAYYLPVPQHSKAIAMSISKCLCEQVDFPRLINTLYQQGCRVFVEMGAGSSLTNWTDKICQHAKVNDYLAVSVNAKGASEQLTLMRAIAKLLSLGIKINVDSFFYGSVIQPLQKY
ncbi:PfaB family protein [Psychromonas sp. MME2]|uniref:PfaB family protein n=1 Tax=unclassified Psychromonas TaxID=2614957 RepID=UPI00339D26B2